VLMTKLRALLEGCGIDGSTALTSAFGCYKFTLPAGASIDVDAVEQAEAALAAGDPSEARSQGSVAAALARCSFLPGEDGLWVEEKRRDLREVLVRSLECLRDASFGAGEYTEAVRHAEDMTELEPFRESGYRRLMECHAVDRVRRHLHVGCPLFFVGHGVLRQVLMIRVRKIANSTIPSVSSPPVGGFQMTKSSPIRDACGDRVRG
jgi:two-component SAPR family response regulator